MRELKFRTFANGSMWHTNGLACSDNSDRMDLVDCSIGGYYKVSDFDYLEDSVTMQYTGLKDKNGKEIYEGDIVVGKMGDTHNGRLIAQIEEIGIVDFANGGFEVNCYPLGGFDEIEVTGNIYENMSKLQGNFYSSRFDKKE